MDEENTSFRSSSLRPLLEKALEPLLLELRELKKEVELSRYKALERQDKLTTAMTQLTREVRDKVLPKKEVWL